MKVLHFYKTYYPDTKGGVEQVIFQIAEGTAKEGVCSQVLSLSSNPSAEPVQIAHHQAHSAKLNFELASTGFSFEALSKFKALATEADLIHYHFPWPFMDVIHLMCGLNKPSIVSYHSDIVKQKSLLKFYTPLMHRFMKSVNTIVAACPNYLSTSPVLQQYREKVEVIPYGLEESTYPQCDTKRLEQWKARVGDRFFLFVGALRYYKGLQFAIEAARKNGLPIVIAGGGGIERKLKRQAIDLSNVHFIGPIDDQDKSVLLTLCTAFIFPSHLRSEAFGVSLLEAAMYAKPMISCEIGTGTTYINIAEQTGLVIPPENVEALSNAMLRLWADQTLCNQLGQAARQRFCELFSAEQMAQRYLNLYQRLIRNNQVHS